MAESLPKVDLTNSPTGCCPIFNPDPWEGKEFTLEGLKFIKASTKSLFHVPLNMGKVMQQTQAAIKAADAESPDRYFMLSEDISNWRANHYFLVTKSVPGYEEVELPGTWFTEVFEGSYNQMGIWFKKLEKDLSDRGHTPSRILAFYTTCPRCAKEYGKNYTVLFAKIDE